MAPSQRKNSPASPYSLLLFIVLTGFRWSHSQKYIAHALSTPSASGDIKIVGLPGGQVQSLPGMYVQTFRRWVVEENDENACPDSTPGAGTESSETFTKSQTIEPIQGAGLSDLPSIYSEGWVNPTSTSELWWPGDLSTLQTRPMLNVLIKNTVLSYVSIGLDVRVPQKDEDDNIVSWRNYGLNSQPLARQWTTLDIAMEKLFHVEGFLVRQSSANQNEQGSEGKELKFESLFPSMNAQLVMQRVANFIGEMDTLSPLAEGFHIVSFPMIDSWTDLPLPEIYNNNEAKDVGNDPVGGNEQNMEEGATYKIVCLATSEPFAEKLLNLDEDILTMSSTSVLEVDVSRTARGGDSPYLTEPYKKLYLK